MAHNNNAPFLERLTEAALDNLPLPEPSNDTERLELIRFSRTQTVLESFPPLNLPSGWETAVWQRIASNSPIDDDDWNDDWDEAVSQMRHTPQTLNTSHSAEHLPPNVIPLHPTAPPQVDARPLEHPATERGGQASGQVRDLQGRWRSALWPVLALAAACLLVIFASPPAYTPTNPSAHEPPAADQPTSIARAEREPSAERHRGQAAPKTPVQQTRPTSTTPNEAIEFAEKQEDSLGAAPPPPALAAAPPLDPSAPNADEDETSGFGNTDNLSPPKDFYAADQNKPQDPPGAKTNKTSGRNQGPELQGKTAEDPALSARASARPPAADLPFQTPQNSVRVLILDAEGLPWGGAEVQVQQDPPLTIRALSDGYVVLSPAQAQTSLMLAAADLDNDKLKKTKDTFSLKTSEDGGAKDDITADKRPEPPKTTATKSDRTAPAGIAAETAAVESDSPNPSAQTLHAAQRRALPQTLPIDLVVVPLDAPDPAQWLQTLAFLNKNLKETPYPLDTHAALLSHPGYGRYPNAQLQELTLTAPDEGEALKQASTSALLSLDRFTTMLTEEAGQVGQSGQVAITSSTTHKAAPSSSLLAALLDRIQWRSDSIVRLLVIIAPPAHPLLSLDPTLSSSLLLAAQQGVRVVLLDPSPIGAATPTSTDTQTIDQLFLSDARLLTYRAIPLAQERTKTGEAALGGAPDGAAVAPPQALSGDTLSPGPLSEPVANTLFGLIQDEITALKP